MSESQDYDAGYECGFRVGVEKAPSYKENQELRDEIARLREEATQLRQAVGVLTTLHPTMEIDVNNPVQMALEIVSYVTESKDAEIERLRAADVLMVAQFESQEREITMLRGLLREGLGLVDEDWTLKDPIHLGEWEDRVREALSE